MSYSMKRCRFCEWYSGPLAGNYHYACEIAHTTDGPEHVCDDFYSGGLLPENATDEELAECLSG